MSLAIYAAPFDNEENYNNESFINKKRNAHNRTQKKTGMTNMQGYNSEKVNTVLNSIHNNSSSEEDSGLGDFKPLSPPTSVGVENTKLKENMANISSNSSSNAPNNNVMPMDNEDNDLHSISNNYMNDLQVQQYYKNLISNYRNTNPSNQNNKQQHYPLHEPSNDNNQVLLDKLNYMINLLEEQQDQKTNNVTEEVVLYSFLGIFIIFIVDSFARVGKYVR
jgi:hypothetical protein